MRKFVLMFLFIVNFLSSRSQSLQDTKSWILSKLNSYKKEYFITVNECKFSDIMQDNYDSKIENDTLIISYDVRPIFKKCFTGDKVKSERNTAKRAIYKVPISDISDVNIINPVSGIVIETKFKTMRSTATFDKGNVESFENIIFVGINLETEENLFKRLQTAFVHLITFYPKKEKQETF
jgi:hypothetical protein